MRTVHLSGGGWDPSAPGAVRVCPEGAAEDRPAADRHGAARR
ncbi:hypothetical protein [Geodermatophilus sp. URMC 60]